MFVGDGGPPRSKQAGLALGPKAVEAARARGVCAEDCGAAAPAAIVQDPLLLTAIRFARSAA